MLYEPVLAEVPEYCVESVREIREHLRDVIDQCESAELRNPLRAIQAACRQFLTDAPDFVKGMDDYYRNTFMESYFNKSYVHNDAGWFFNQALGALRARVGTSITIIIQTFDIDVDEHLAAILPPPVEEETNEDNPR